MLFIQNAIDLASLSEGSFVDLESSSSIDPRSFDRLDDRSREMSGRRA